MEITNARIRTWNLVMFVCFLSVWILAGCAGSRQHPGTADRHIAVAQSLRDTAHRFESAGDRQEALRYHHLLLQHARNNNLQEQEAITLKDIALLLKEQDAGVSLANLHKALHIARSLRHLRLQADIYHAIADVYMLQQNYTAAVEALESHGRLLDSVLTREHNRDMVAIRTENRGRFERGIILTASIAILVIAVIGFFYYRKTRTLNKELMDSIVIKDKLFSILGHDLRGPAGSMMQALALFASGAFTPEEEDRMRTLLKKQSESLYLTIETMFQWANSQLNGVHMHPQQIDSGAAIEKNIRFLAGQAEQKKIRMEPELQPGTVIVADPAHFDYIVRNLLSNAIKFSFEDSVIKVVTKQEDNAVVISISDKGIGIPADKQKQFETNNMELAFGTAGESGIGLGLSLAKTFINANKGKIWLKSEENVGTTVFFSFPLAQA